MTNDSKNSASSQEQKKLLAQEIYFKASQEIRDIVDRAESNSGKSSRASDQEEIDKLLARIETDY